MDNNNASVQVPDFTRGHWNDIKAYKHAFASPEDEAAAAQAAKYFTDVIEKYWKDEAKAAKKAAKAAKKAKKI